MLHSTLYIENNDFELSTTATAQRKTSVAVLSFLSTVSESFGDLIWVHDLKRSCSCRCHTQPSPQQMPLSREKLCCTAPISPPYLLPLLIFNRSDPYLRWLQLEPFDFMIIGAQKKLLWIFEFSFYLMLTVHHAIFFFFPTLGRGIKWQLPICLGSVGGKNSCPAIHCIALWCSVS